MRSDPGLRRPTAVLKFGGSAFGTVARYEVVARFLAGRLQRGLDRLVVVVSAMAGKTDELVALTDAAGGTSSLAAVDAVLATGEVVSAALLEMALRSLGIRAVSLTAYSNGLHCDDRHTRAQVQRFDTEPIVEALEANQVVVLAGGQALTPAGRVALLGRNSSDLTAVIAAGGLGLDACEIFSDVPGVFTADPRVVPAARLLAEVPYELTILMSRHGAKVLHHGSVEHAAAHGVRIVCRPLDFASPASTVVGRGALHPVVVTGSGCETFSFASELDRERARRLLEACGVGCLAAPLNGRAALAVVDRALHVKDLLAQAGIAAIGEGRLGVLVAIDGVGIDLQIVSGPDRLAELARTRHAVLVERRAPPAPPLPKYSLLNTRKDGCP